MSIKKLQLIGRRGICSILTLGIYFDCGIWVSLGFLFIVLNLEITGHYVNKLVMIHIDALKKAL